MKQSAHQRIQEIQKAVLSPDMANIQDLERYIHMTWEQIGDRLTASPIRVGQTDTASYLHRVENATIPEQFSGSEALLGDLAFYMQGLLKWNSPGVMINVNPPAMTLPIAATACCSMFNPNLAMDVPSGNLAFAELEVMKMLSDLAMWDPHKSAGVMTFGGKGTVLYAVRAGLHNCCPQLRQLGIHNQKFKVFSTEQGHPCHYEVCEWLVIGRDNCVSLPVNADGSTRLDLLEQGLREAIRNGYRIACIVANGGSTLYATVDEIDKIVAIRDAMVQEFSLDYIPHIHVDSVIGWAWLMFRGYDFRHNPLGFTDDALEHIRHVYEAIRHIEKADSFGADFHKTGFSPYLCSAVVFKDKKKLYALGEENQAPLDQLEFGLYAPFTFTLESSRPATSALSAWLSLKQLGKDGYRRILGTLAESGSDLRSHFENAPYARCRNLSGHGFAALAMLFPTDLRQRSRQNLESFTDDELLRIAKYNHTFYLYLLGKQVHNEVDFALDYVSKQTDVRGIKIGVMKLYPMSPFCTLDYLDGFYDQFEAILAEFDQTWETLDLQDSPYRPKPFVTR